MILKILKLFICYQKTEKFQKFIVEKITNSMIIKNLQFNNNLNLLIFNGQMNQ